LKTFHLLTKNQGHFVKDIFSRTFLTATLTSTAISFLIKLVTTFPAIPAFCKMLLVCVSLVSLYRKFEEKVLENLKYCFELLRYSFTNKVKVEGSLIETKKIGFYSYREIQKANTNLMC
jgi:hypothetical protein